MSFEFMRNCNPQWVEPPQREIVGAKVEKSRATGARIGRPARLTADQVRALREEYRLRKSLRTVKQMAKDFNTNESNMNCILKGHTYKWVRE